MLRCADDLVALIEARLPNFVQLAASAVSQTPGLSQYTETDLRQMVVGFAKILTDRVKEEGGESMAFFMDTVIPGLIANGEELPRIIHTSMLFLGCIVADLSQQVAVESRPEFNLWIGGFCADYLTAMVTSGMSALARSA
jgi:hypothetical protein